MVRRTKEILADFTGLADPAYDNFQFRSEPTGFHRSRLGTLRCPHGTINTPNFIFCGTRATVKGVMAEDLTQMKTDIVLANTYHLLISPGEDLIAEAGGLHRFMRWNGPILTDSGGYQVFAMGFGSVSEEIKGKRLRGQKTVLKITEEGVRFKSYKDGKRIELTPERAIQIQQKLGADFIVQFDECTPFHATKDYTATSTALSLRWGDRSLAEFIRNDSGRQALYAVVQGGVFGELRKMSASYIAGKPFFGTAIGGCLGQTAGQMRDVVALVMAQVPRERPVHLLGIGKIDDIFHGVCHGIDTFDCVHPTRIARHGHAIMQGVAGNSLNLRNEKFRNDHSPLLEESDLPVHRYSKAYIHHLFRTGEMLGAQILSMHNIFMMNWLMRDIRQGLQDKNVPEVYKRWVGKNMPTDWFA